ncbi:hypothetical protein HY622_04330 [Candidatus Uhrbacteria bacterium]|nr:hypothetical protein [Candidatus Uhrbacteria bacterium]
MKTTHRTSLHPPAKLTKQAIISYSVLKKLEAEYEKEARSILATVQKRLTAVIADAGAKLRNLKKAS